MKLMGHALDGVLEGLRRKQLDKLLDLQQRAHNTLDTAIKLKEEAELTVKLVQQVIAEKTGGKDDR